ncbi:MAG: C1 family peptidase, partial [Bacteroidales bacterium]|nr:C1 family peptidase [Bacteroidales bacterium]
EKAPLPRNIDWRNMNGDGYVTSIKDQGNCGSCVAFGTVATLESRVRVLADSPVNKNSKILPDLSEAQLFFCGGGSSGRNCGNGWWISAALSFFKDSGIAPESCFPYSDHDQSCKLSKDWRKKLTRVNDYHIIRNIEDMKEWLSCNGPLVTGFNVYQDFFSYKSGVYRHVKGEQKGGHCISCVGYDDKKEAWICKNSWGTGWGEHGYFLIGYGQCGIDAYMYAIDDCSEVYPLYNDYFLRDSLNDFGQIPVSGTLCYSPDIVPAGMTILENPSKTLEENWFKDMGKDIVGNTDNHIYLRGRNLSDEAKNIKLYLYYSKASLLLFPSLWKNNSIKNSNGNDYYEGSVSRQGEVLVSESSFLWKPDKISKDDHYCLIARAETSAHPNPVPDIDKISDFAKFIAENPGFVWRNVSVTSKDTPSFSVALDYEQGTGAEEMYFIISCLNNTKGSSVSLTCGAKGPQPAINIPRTKINQENFIVGTVAEVPAGFKGNIVFNYWKDKVKIESEWEIRVSAFYLPGNADLFCNTVKLELEGMAPRIGILVGDYIISGKA